ncbi:MAG: DUF3575 domain-containing protein [Prevotella sp.]|jgi:hypothetical protein|nr:DUF3575 domain-containing protein [Prevotella sp.]
MYSRNIKIVCLVFLFVFATKTNAQVIDDAVKVDTLTLAERLSVKTNMVDWSLLTPNIGVEFDLKSTNWSRWAVGLNFRYRWSSTHTFSPGLVYNIGEVKAEVRNYWRTMDLSGPSHIRLSKHKKWIDKAVSQRRSTSKHPVTAYYRGFYLSYTDFSLLLGRTGRQGQVFQAGVTYGIVRPLYQFANGNSIDMDLGISVGAAYAKYDKYTHDREDNCYPVTGHENWHFINHPVVNEIRAGFVYHFGNYPVTKKYRRRYDVDLKYQAYIDSINQMRQRLGFEKHYKDSVYNVMFNEFEHLYDSISRAQLVIKDSIAFANRGITDIQQQNVKADEKTALKTERQMDAVQKKNDKIQQAAENKLAKEQKAANRKAEKERKEKQAVIDKQKALEEKTAKKKRQEEAAAAKKARKQEAVEAKKARKIQDQRDEEARHKRAKALEDAQQKLKEEKEAAQ